VSRAEFKDNGKRVTETVIDKNGVRKVSGGKDLKGTQVAIAINISPQ
jgi:hypothetical protein